MLCGGRKCGCLQWGREAAVAPRELAGEGPRAAAAWKKARLARCPASRANGTGAATDLCAVALLARLRHAGPHQHASAAGPGWIRNRTRSPRWDASHSARPGQRRAACYWRPAPACCVPALMQHAAQQQRYPPVFSDHRVLLHGGARKQAPAVDAALAKRDARVLGGSAHLHGGGMGHSCSWEGCFGQARHFYLVLKAGVCAVRSAMPQKLNSSSPVLPRLLGRLASPTPAPHTPPSTRTAPTSSFSFTLRGRPSCTPGPTDTCGAACAGGRWGWQGGGQAPWAGHMYDNNP